MVSLKSFKPISEAERDDTLGQASSSSRQGSNFSTFSLEQQYAINNSRIMPQHTKINGTSLSLQDRNEAVTQNNNNNNSSTRLEYETMKLEKKANCSSSSCIPLSTTKMAETKKNGTNKALVKVVLPVVAPTPMETTNTQVSKNVVTKQTPSPQVHQDEISKNEHSSSSSSSISIVVVQHDNLASSSHNTTISGDDYTQDESISHSLDELNEAEQINSRVNRPAVIGLPVAELAGGNFLGGVGTPQQSDMNKDIRLYPTGGHSKGSAGLPINDSRLTLANEGAHFEIVWSNLSYRIEPKWYKKINILDRVFSHFILGQMIDNHSSANSTASSSAGMNDNQHQMHTSTNADGHIHNALNPRHKSSLDPIEIFTNLNGTIKSGQMTAVLGPSGAGKTTLLNCLTGKLRKGVSGHINLIGANGKHLKMCTIPQKDHLLELLTVEENLWFASKIKNPELGFDHVKNIERVIDLLGLKRCRSAKIKKISGGQYKRVSIAQELLSNPDILVLDEPTSGLDSLTCFKTISMLRDLVELSASNDFMKPMAIIVTIHQPQPKVFNLFHHVYILANGGRVIYEGAPELSMTTITSVTGLQPIDGPKSTCMTVGIDPASFLIEIASEEYGAEPIKTLYDHQRRVFYEANIANYSQFHNGHNHNLNEGRFHLQSDLEMNAKDNHAFSSDFENETKSTIFVPNQMYGKDTKESSNNNNNDNEKRGKSVISSGIDSQKGPKSKRRKKSSYSIESKVSSSFSGRSGETSQGMGARSPSNNSLYMSEQLLYTREANHKGRFWAHTATLTHRTLLTIRRDPLLMTSRVLFHLMIPILMGHVYGKATGAANACPHYEPEIDITQIPSLVEGKRIEYMLEELHMSIENVSMFFIIMYAFAAAVLALNALSFPLNMQVLLKETRNGWYSMSSYVLAKTLADLPLELTMPCLTMALVYPLTGQPSSYLQWRMLTICLIMTLCSLIAQTQALILGALVMNSVQTAVFVSQASQLPWVILAGFTIRIKRLSEPLKLISLTSFYRLGCEAITLTRYGFGICPCDPQEITGEPVRLVGIPDQLRTIAQYWIDSMEASKANNDTSETVEDQSTSLATTPMIPTSTASVVSGAGSTKTDIFQHLANQLSYANSYGVNITSCDDVAPDRIRAINLSDNWLVARIWHLFIMLVIMKVLLYYAVKFSISIRL